MAPPIRVAILVHGARREHPQPDRQDRGRPAVARDARVLVAQRDVPVGPGVHGHDPAHRAQAFGAQMPRPARPSRADRRAFEERLDPLAGPFIEVVVGQDEARTTRRSGAGARGLR